MSQTVGSVSPEYLMRVVGCQKRRGKGAVRISRLNTWVPRGSDDSPLSCSGSKRPPRRGVYFLPLMMLRASPSPACPRVSWSRSEGAFAPSAAAALPFPSGGECTASVCCTSYLRDCRAHARRRALGLLHSSLLDEHLCLVVQAATRSRRWLGHCLEFVGRSDEFLADRFQFRWSVDVVVG